MNPKKKYKITIFIISAIICLIVIYLNLLSHERSREIYLKQTKKIVINMKKDFLKDTVNNILSEIDNLRASKQNSYKKNIEARFRRLEDELDLSNEEFIQFYIDKFKDDVNSKMWKAILWNNGTGEVLYSSSEITVEELENSAKKLIPLLSSYSIINKGDIEGVFWSKKNIYR